MRCGSVTQPKEGRKQKQENSELGPPIDTHTYTHTEEIEKRRGDEAIAAVRRARRSRARKRRGAKEASSHVRLIVAVATHHPWRRGLAEHFLLRLHANHPTGFGRVAGPGRATRIRYATICKHDSRGSVLV